MSSFSVAVVKAQIEAHPDPEVNALEVCRVGDYKAVVRKDQFKQGDLIAYIPEQALVPQELLRELGLEGKLAGPDKNRVKAIRIRGLTSQGLVIPAKPHWVEGQDVTEELGIEKWQPPIPAHMAGEVSSLDPSLSFHYDIENVKKWGKVLQEGEEVCFGEKLHGSWCCIGSIPGYNEPVISSKGLFAKSLHFKLNEKNKHNVYVRAEKTHDVFNKIRSYFDESLPVYVLGEVLGVQDLKYGTSTQKDETLGFRVFDIYVGYPGHGTYLDDAELDEACEEVGLRRVPVLYRGPFSKETMLTYTNGKETVSGQSLHVREGIVIRPTVEREDPKLGRVQLKSVSEDYLTRKKGTEFQ